MELPDRVDIGPIAYRVTTDRSTINQATVDSHISFYANIRFGEADILIDDKQMPGHQRLTLLHEVLHGCFHITMLDKKWEETAVRLLAGPLLDTLRRNPDLVAFLLATDEAAPDA
jgi:hypothetical protein